MNFIHKNEITDVFTADVCDQKYVEVLLCKRKIWIRFKNRDE